MNYFEKFALVAAIFVTWFRATATASAWEIYVVWRGLSPQMTAVSIIGWFICSYGPIFIALLFWRWSKSVRWPWVFHLLFLPCAFVALREGELIMLYATQSRDFDSTVGAPVITGLYMSVVAVLGYAVALGVKLASWLKARVETA